MEIITTSPYNTIIENITENITYGYTVIKDVFTKDIFMKDIFQNDDYIYTTLLIMSIFAPISYFTLRNQQKIKNAMKQSTNNKNDINNILKKEPVSILTGLYLESVKEINDNGKTIIESLNKDTTYWILLRVQMKNYLQMIATKCQLHGNNITGNTDENFATRDMYMIVRFKSLNEKNTDILFGNVIVKFMNYLNKLSDKKYHTTDFVVCAIGTTPYTDSTEFTNGLKNINYEVENYKNITIQTEDGNHSINYSLMLPVHNIYDLFMDVYNNNIFESRKYVIDDDNYESWDGKSINNMKF